MGSTLTNLVYHIIFSTKGREQIITTEIRDKLYHYIGGIVRTDGGVLLEIGGMPDHLHLVIKLKPAHALSVVMQKVKGYSSKWVNENHRSVGRFGWQEGYAAFAVSESRVQAVVQYVKGQEEHHKKQSFEEEFVLILKRHKVEYDEKYLWT